MHKFAHVGISAKDMEESIKFYTEILKCKILEDRTHPGMRLVFLDAGGTVVELVYREENCVLPDGPVNHMAFDVENLDSEIEFLKKSNISLLGNPKTVGKSRIIFFKGPNGEKIEFSEHL
ncbi:MAG: VOC family protein [Peptostreptococcaceae bacterium]|nr:VOC family protein [Peptostreptococcaceae bacterium]